MTVSGRVWYILFYAGSMLFALFVSIDVLIMCLVFAVCFQENIKLKLLLFTFLLLQHHFVPVSARFLPRLSIVSVVLTHLHLSFFFLFLKVSEQRYGPEPVPFC